MALMLLHFNVFLPPTFLHFTFTKLTVYLNFIIFLSTCLYLPRVCFSILVPECVAKGSRLWYARLGEAVYCRRK